MKQAASAEVEFRINREEPTGKVRRTVFATFPASVTFDVGVDTSSPIANDCFDKPPFQCEGTVKRLHFRYLEAE